MRMPLLSRELRPGAEWRVASDDPTCQAWVTRVMVKQILPRCTSADNRKASGLAADALRDQSRPRRLGAAVLDVRPALMNARAMPRP